MKKPNIAAGVRGKKHRFFGNIVMSYDDDLRNFILKFSGSNVLDNTDTAIDFLSKNFKFSGSKISLKNEKRYCDYEFQNWEGISLFFELNQDIKTKIISSNEICYIGDNLTEIGVSFNGTHFFELLEFLFHNIPEHYYFFNLTDKWCLFITTEGYIEYGEK